MVQHSTLEEGENVQTVKEGMHTVCVIITACIIGLIINICTTVCYDSLILLINNSTQWDQLGGGQARCT